MYQKVNELAKQIEEQVIGWRRDFHKYAEAGWTEYRTSTIIADHLTKLGYEVLIGDDVTKAEDRMGLPSEEVLERHYQRAIKQGALMEYLPPMRGGHTGVVGILRCGEGPVVGMRFDIDAVDMKESDDPERYAVKEGYNSVNDEAMHSCGHDGHASMGMGVAILLSELKEHLHGTVKLVFQPAEEGVRGAKSVVTKGLLDDVDFMFGSHLGSGTPLGSFACGRGNFLATNKFDAFITGAPSHAGGSPERGKNAIVAASTAVLNLYSIPRHSGGPTRINVGRLNAGTGRNVIAPSAHLAVETRGQTTDLSKYMYDYAIRILENAAAMHDCKLEIKAMGEAQSAKSDQVLADRVGVVAEKSGLFNNITALPGKGGGSEDYTYMMTRVQENGGQATFMGFGADMGGWAHHVAEFDIDEAALINGVQMFTLMALDILK